MSVNLVTDYGATPDGQIITTTVTISSSVNPTHLQVTGNPFVVGDVGKLIAIQDANVPGAALLTTIASFTDANHVVLTDPCTNSISAVSELVEWGTDCTPAFAAFNAAFVGQSGVTLIIPGNAGTGFYCCGISGGESFGAFFGIVGLTVQGTNNPTISDLLGTAGLFFGGVISAIKSTGTTYALTNDVAAGSTQIVLKTAGESSNFTVNKWALMTGYDPQGFGFPPNPQWHQWVFVTNITGGTITIQSPLTDAYKSTWPMFNSAVAGPAALFIVNDGWDCTQVYDGMTIRSFVTLTNAIGRNITTSNCIFPQFGLNCSTTQSFTMDTCTILNSLWELDKINDTVNVTNCTLHGIDVQSSSTNQLNLTNCTIGNLKGTPKKSVQTGCHFTAAWKAAPTSYGFTYEIACTNCIFDPGTMAWTGVTDPGLESNGYTMSGGIITRPKSAEGGTPPPWAIPGAVVFWAGRSDAHALFQITDITDDATNIYIHTNQSGGFPVFTFFGNPIAISASDHPAIFSTFINCTGCADAIALSASPNTRIPLNTYWRKTYSDNGIGEVLIRMKGTLVSIKVNVTKAYTGIHTPLLMSFNGPFYIDGFLYTLGWNPQFDVGATGARTITPSAVTGSTGSDNMGSAPGSIWLLDDQMRPVFNSDISGENPSVYPTYEVEFITDQGIQPAPSPTSPQIFTVNSCDFIVFR